ncbi:hypothetical protein P1X14_08200 [Sphingomonas sp. AOB5]|uniref:hypothetical protein n=1 Tax=Sphingomonas sp. AOB5 TaxID=3034017 RepID=UPI0023F88ADF|nr:hypothetical protein [Sphingomonas sp. AOB5]MDF7775224.1 hypothetical protein [Sphingomonas sp. AOB5]
MTIFEYFMVLLSVMLSLALAQLVTGAGELIRARGLVRWSFGYALWLVIGFLLVLDWRTSLWLVRGVGQWRLVTLVFMLLQASTIYLYVLWLVPKGAGDSEIDLRDYLVTNRRLFLTAFGIYCVLGWITNVMILPPEAMMDLANYATLGPALALTVLAWVTSNRWVHRLVPVAVLGMMIAYFALYFQTIG